MLIRPPRRLARRAPSSYRTIAEMLARGDDATLAAPGLVRPALVARAARSRRRARRSSSSPARRPPSASGARPPRFSAGSRCCASRTAPTCRGSDAAPTSSEVGARARALYALDKNRPVVVVASARALLRTVPPQGSHVFDPLVLAPAATLDLEEALELLARMGYERVEVAEEPGQFAVRGGMLDVYPRRHARAGARRAVRRRDRDAASATCPRPARRSATPNRSRSIPCRELALVVARRRGRREGPRRQGAHGHRARARPRAARAGVYFNGVERYLPLLYKRVGAAHRLPRRRRRSSSSPSRARSSTTPSRRREELVRLAAQAAARDAARRALPHARRSSTSASASASRCCRCCAPAAASTPSSPRAAPRSPAARSASSAACARCSRPGYAVALAVPGPPRAQPHRRRARRRRASRSPSERDHADAPTDGAMSTRARSTRGVVDVTDTDVPAGFVIPDAQGRGRLASTTSTRARRSAARAARSTRRASPSPSRRATTSCTRRTASRCSRRSCARRCSAQERDYLLLEYAKGDKLYVPVEQIDRVTKYVGADGSVAARHAPQHRRLVAGDRQGAQGRARSSRSTSSTSTRAAPRSPATRIAPDTPWQLEMEAAFPFEETPDQLAAIADVKADMESDKPMDRLICGDVGYGKTEVAIRAAFKATQDGKQVMVLCPTTILAQQHFTTFSERFAPFPVRVEVLSRFRSRRAAEGRARGLRRAARSTSSSARTGCSRATWRPRTSAS